MTSSPVLAVEIDDIIVPTLRAGMAAWYARVAADRGHDPDELDHDFFQGDFKEVLQGRLDLYVALHRHFQPREDLADQLEELVACAFERTCLIDRTVLAEIDVWRRRTGGRTFVASNQEHHRIAYLRDRTDLAAHFDDLVYSASLGVCKPDRLFFAAAQARMGVAAAQSILFVDPAPESVDGARMCGWRAMLYRGPESLGRALAQWG